MFGVGKLYVKMAFCGKGSLAMMDGFGRLFARQLVPVDFGLDA
jgi:hypothetical protein